MKILNKFQRDTKIALDTEYRFNTSQYQNADYSEIIVNEDNLEKIFNQKVIEDSFMKAFKIGKILNKKGLIIKQSIIICWNNIN